MIYFIRQNDYVKIGYTENINSRLAQLQTGTPYELSVALLIPGSLEDEGELHKAFIDDKVRGEWFMLSDDMRDYIKTMMGEDLRYDLGLLDRDGLDVSTQTSFYRNVEHLTLRQVGEKMDMTPQSVKEIEIRELHGTVSINVLRKYADAIGYDLVYKFVKKE